MLLIHAKKFFISFLAASFITGCALIFPEDGLKESEIGVLLLAHGSGNEWNQNVKKALAEAQGQFKREVVFGMGEVRSIQYGIEKLETAKAKAIVVVPLFISSHSEMYRQIEYVLWIRNEPDVLFWLLMEDMASGHGGGHQTHESKPDFLEQARFSVPHAVTSPINYDPLIAEIIVQNLNKPGRKGSIFLLAHGPISEEDNKKWLQDLEKYSRYFSLKFPESSFFGLTFRDDAPEPIRNMAIRKIKDAVKRETSLGRKIIIAPFLLSRGGREMEIRKILAECECEIIPHTILPHPNVSVWIERQVKRGVLSLTTSKQK